MFDHPLAHFASAGAVVAAFVGWLPPIAALLGIIWYAITISESATFQAWWTRVKASRRAKKLAKLKAKEKLVIAEIQAIETVRAAKVEASELVAGAKADAEQLVVQEARTAAASHAP